MYEFHNFLRLILLLMYSFWIPQIITNVIRDSRKPLHPHYILGMTVTRLAIPLYIFGCPNNFMRISPDTNWCICLCLDLLRVSKYFRTWIIVIRKDTNNYVAIIIITKVVGKYINVLDVI